MSDTRQVALIVDFTCSYHRKIARGVIGYVRDVARWNLCAEEGPMDRLPDFRHWRGDGVIACFNDRKVAAAVSKLKIPVVGIEGQTGWYDPASRIPYLCGNSRSIGRIGAEHLLGQGHTRLAYCGLPRTRLTPWSQERGEAFREQAREAGVTCAMYRGRYAGARKWPELQRHLASWLASLEKPAGLMACNDSRARHVLEACRAIGARVPDDIAVLGVDNDAILCEVTRPPLSSVEQGAVRLGYQAAELLERLMARKRTRRIEHRVEPEGVVIRRSTDALAIEEAEVAAAVRFIREHACDEIHVLDVVEAAGISRSVLEISFKAVMGRTIHNEIRRVRIEEARKRIITTDAPLKQIAAQTGMGNVQHMTRLFRQHLDQTPGHIRRNARI